jgi:hypothetical protein
LTGTTHRARDMLANAPTGAARKIELAKGAERDVADGLPWRL